jgi:hypothetical protein
MDIDDELLGLAEGTTTSKSRRSKSSKRKRPVEESSEYVFDTSCGCVGELASDPGADCAGSLAPCPPTPAIVCRTLFSARRLRLLYRPPPNRNDDSASDMDMSASDSDAPAAAPAASSSRSKGGRVKSAAQVDDSDDDADAQVRATDENPYPVEGIYKDEAERER